MEAGGGREEEGRGMGEGWEGGGISERARECERVRESTRESARECERAQESARESGGECERV